MGDLHEDLRERAKVSERREVIKNIVLISLFHCQQTGNKHFESSGTFLTLKQLFDSSLVFTSVTLYSCCFNSLSDFMIQGSAVLCMVSLTSHDSLRQGSTVLHVHRQVCVSCCLGKDSAPR